MPIAANTPTSCERNWRRYRHCETWRFEQELDYPTVKVTVDRERAGVLGVTTDDVAKSARRGHVIQSLHLPELLGRSQERHWLSGAGRDPRAADELPRGGEEPSHRSPVGPTDRPARCGQRHRRHGARRIRSLQHAAHADTEREHLRRGSGTRGRPSAASDQRYRKAARSGERDSARADRSRWRKCSEACVSGS